MSMLGGAFDDAVKQVKATLAPFTPEMSAKILQTATEDLEQVHVTLKAIEADAVSINELLRKGKDILDSGELAFKVNWGGPKS